MIQSSTAVKLQYVPLSSTVDWSPIAKAHKKGTMRNVLKITKRIETPDGEVYYEGEVEGHELDSYYVKIITSKFGSRGSCHCIDFQQRRLPNFKYNKVGQWCKHLLALYVAIRNIEVDLPPVSNE
jgi:hypothetical protein